LEAARTGAFVGRRAERELFASALGEDPGAWSVLWLHGPGGVGKSTLLARLAADARDVGAEVRFLAASDLAAADLAPADEVFAGVPDRDVGRVVFVDSAECLGPAEVTLRTRLLPGLVTGARLVVAGRFPPGPEWRSDPAWRDRLRIVSLRNLDAADADRYLRQFHVDGNLRPVLVEASHGHPMALSLLADLSARGQLRDIEVTAGLAGAPDVVRALLIRIVDDVPTREHRDVLEVAAVARVTTEALIRSALGVDRQRAGELFDWLRGRPYMAVGPEGLSPHDLIRDVLDADLRWRDPDAYAAVFRRVRRHIHARLEMLRGVEQRRAIADEKFVFRNLPSVLSPVDWSNWGVVEPEPAGTEDRDVVIGLVHDFEGPDAATIADQWWDRQPEAFHVLRDPVGAVLGFIGLVTLTPVADGDPDLTFDPVAAAAVAWAERASPARAGEVITQTRFVIDRDHYQAPSVTLNAVPILTLQRYLQTPDLAWDFLVLFEPDALNDYFAIADLPRAPDADATVGGRRYGQFAHDFRRVPVRDWLEGVTDRALAQDPSPPAAAPPELVVLPHEAFTEAVRQAMRDLHRPDRLATNPLVRSRLVHDHPVGAEHPTTALRELLRSAVDVLAADPRDEKRHRAVARTYLVRAGSQERVAEQLGLPFSTFRRHLTEGVDTLVEHLWQRELHGPIGPADTN
jgi:hypothetical protein